MFYFLGMLDFEMVEWRLCIYYFISCKIKDRSNIEQLSSLHDQYIHKVQDQEYRLFHRLPFSHI